MHISGSVAFASLLSGATAAVQGFNYGAQGEGGVKVEADFEFEFNAAKKLAGTDGAFTSARLYTMCVSKASH
jgi:glucan endo-1,3-beta-D-glucosidase